MSSKTAQPHCYAKRDIVALDRHGGHYSRHISAMTTENLFSKSCIAAELGHRDFVIVQLQNERFERMKPKTEEELLELMPESWVDLIRMAKVLRDKYSDAEASTRDRAELVALMNRALDVTDYCVNCQGNGTYNVCGNIETCGCGQREKSNGCKTFEEEDPTKG